MRKKHLKIYLRCTAEQKQLNNLAVLYINRGIEVDLLQLIKEFDKSSKIRRKIKLIALIHCNK